MERRRCLAADRRRTSRVAAPNGPPPVKHYRTAGQYPGFCVANLFAPSSADGSGRIIWYACRGRWVSQFGLLAPGLFQYVFHSGSPEPMQMLSQIGLVLLMFQIGLEFDFSHLNEPRNRKAMLWVAAASLIAPFALGYGVGQISAPTLSPSAHPVASALIFR